MEIEKLSGRDIYKLASRLKEESGMWPSGVPGPMALWAIVVLRAFRERMLRILSV